ncbi:MAG: PEP-CTERM sorting domain-containing protein [Bryobacteraceae bacterium]
MKINLTRLLVAFVLLVGSLSAAPIGTLNITGSVNVSGTGMDGELDFLPLDGGDGTFTVDLFTQSGSFVDVAGTTGTIQDLNNTDQPVGTPFNLENFLTFSADPGMSLSLTFIDPGAFTSTDCFAPVSAGQNCTPPGSQFNLSNVGGPSGTVNSVVSFSVAGLASDATGSLPYTGTFSTQFTGIPYQNLLNTVATGGSVQATYSANFVVVPEPGTATLFLGSGALLLVGGFLRRRKK